MKVYITKFALTKGILEKEVEVCTNVNVDMVRTIEKPIQHFHKNEWFTNRQEAIDYADFLRLKKISTLQRQIIKLQNLIF